MPRIQVVPFDQSGFVAAILVRTEAEILPVVQRLDCKDADVLKDGEYCYSVRLGENGAWCIFHRRSGERDNVVPLDR